jgi:colanic acid/amylovoran biosynthesis glycosyltransferase
MHCPGEDGSNLIGLTAQASFQRPMLPVTFASHAHTARPRYIVRMKLAYITRAFPFATLGETFLGPEMQVLASLCDQLHVLPVRPQFRHSVLSNASRTVIDARMSLIDVRVAVYALAEFVTHPRQVLRALALVLAPRYRLSAKLKNVMVFPKGLAVGRYVRRNGIEHIHAHWLTTPATVAYVASLMTGVRWSCTAHAHDIFADNLISEKATSACFVRIISERNCRSFERLTGGRYAARTRVVHVGVDVPTKEAQRTDGRTLRILCPARFHAMKGHRDLLDALTVLRDAGVAFHCDLAGDGELRRDIEAHISRLALERHVTFRGAVPHERLLDEIQSGSYDVVALASVEDKAVTWIFEGIPVALVEAMSSGIPCVATRVGSMAELIDARCGILVEQHDPQALGAALIRLARSPELRKLLGAAARTRVQRDFDVRITARGLYELIAREGAGAFNGPSNVSSSGQ